MSLDCAYSISWALNLKELDKAARKARIMDVRLQASNHRYTQLSIAR